MTKQELKNDAKALLRIIVSIIIIHLIIRGASEAHQGIIDLVEYIDSTLKK